MTDRWLGLFRAKAPPKSTDAYRTAALVADHDLELVAPLVDDDVEAPPVMVRVEVPKLGPDEIVHVSMYKRLVLGVALCLVAVVLTILRHPH